MAETAPQDVSQEVRAAGVGRPPTATDNRRILVLAHLGAGLIVWYLIAEGLAIVWANWPGSPAPPVRGFSWPQIAGVGAAVISVVVGFRHQGLQTWANEVINELRKVTWPTWKETRHTTVVVMIATSIIAGILGAFDFVWAKAIKALLGAG